MQASVGVPSSVATVAVMIKVNGVNSFQTTILPSQYAGSVTIPPTKPELSSTDYVSFDITTSGNAQELILRFMFEQI